MRFPHRRTKIEVGGRFSSAGAVKAQFKSLILPLSEPDKVQAGLGVGKHLKNMARLLAAALQSDI